MDKITVRQKTTPDLRQYPGRAIMKLVELRGLEPLTPSLPVRWTGPIYLRKRRNRRKNGSVQCGSVQLTAVVRAGVLQDCSSENRVKADHRAITPCGQTSIVVNQDIGFNSERAIFGADATSVVGTLGKPGHSALDRAIGTARRDRLRKAIVPVAKHIRPCTVSASTHPSLEH
jgi:hypothetical protein